MKKLFIAFALLLTALGAASAKPAAETDYNSPTRVERQNIQKELNAALRQSKTAQDSLRIYFDLFDVSQRRLQRHIVDTLLVLSRKTGDERVELEVLRHKANLNPQDSLMLQGIIRDIDRMEPTDLAKETRLFVRLIMVQSEIQELNDDVAPEGDILTRLISRYTTNPPQDPYENFEILFMITTLAGNLGEGSPLDNYVVMLDEDMAKLPLTTGAIRNLIYTRNAINYTNHNQHARAIDYDRKLLDIIDHMEEQYASQGRRYRNYNTYRYNIYRRMLANANALRRPEVERLYNNILELAERDQDVEADLNYDKRAHIYYYLATGQFDKAAPMLLDRLTNSTQQLPYRELLYNNLIKAAEATGDRETLLTAYKLYSDILKSRLKSRTEESARELAVAYSVNDIREKNAQTIQQFKDRELHYTRMLVGVAIVIIILLVIVAMVLYRKRRNERESARSLREVNDTLVQERDNLAQARKDLIKARDEAKHSDKLKTEFINNMSHEVRAPLNAIAECSQLIIDCIPEDKKDYLDRFGRIIELNVQLMLRLVNDVLDIASLENKKLSVNEEPLRLQEVCVQAMENTRENFKPGVELKLQASAQDLEALVVTDRLRVVQVLTNLLSNSAKFTEHGSVTLNLAINRETGTVEFDVTDTGIGVPKGAEEIIFERFRQVNQGVRGLGLGLYISRLVARLLGGDVVLDRDHKPGARFVFTFPLAE